MRTSFYRCLLALTPEERRRILATIPPHTFRLFPSNEPWLPCPDPSCRQWRLFFQTRMVGRPDCPVCGGEGFVPKSALTGKEPPPPCEAMRVYFQGRMPG